MPHDAPNAPTPDKIPLELAAEMRRLLHDLGNSLEVILQTGFLLGTQPLDENGREWARMLDDGARQSARISQQLREYIRAHS